MPPHPNVERKSGGGGGGIATEEVNNRRTYTSRRGLGVKKDMVGNEANILKLNIN